MWVPRIPLDELWMVILGLFRMSVRSGYLVLSGKVGRPRIPPMRIMGVDSGAIRVVS